MSSFWLSKSTYIRSLQCQKSLYLNKFHKDKRDPIPEERKKLFQEGTDFGLMAQKLFPNGKDATPEKFWNFNPSIKKTEDWLGSKTPTIYEAAFQAKGVVVALDILNLENDLYTGYEVKRSGKVKDVFIEDAALQYFIIKQSGLMLQQMNLLLLNYDVLGKDNIQIQDMFNKVDVTQEILALQDEIPNRLNQAFITLKQGYLPSRNMGEHCHSPYDCDFIGFCKESLSNQN